MSVLPVDTTAALKLALASAQSGDTILLGAGTYSGVSLSGLHFATDVTITSADPGHQAVITDLKVTDCNGLQFSNLEVNVAPGAADGYAVNVKNAQDIHFDHLNFHGTLNNDTSDDRSGLGITGSSDVSVTNSEFHELRNGIGLGTTTGVQVSGNSFHDIRTDGVDNTVVSNAVISGNVFTNFHHLAGDHSDAIQFWTAGRTIASHDITISNNVIVEGSGIGMQGIFMADEVGTLPYQNVQITDNVILGGNWNAIYVGHGQDITVTGNDLVAQVRPAGTGLATEARLTVKNSDNVTVANNQATTYNLSADTHLTQTSDTKSTNLTDTLSTSVHDWVVDNLTGFEAETTATLTLAGISFAPPTPEATFDVADSLMEPYGFQSLGDSGYFGMLWF